MTLYSLDNIYEESEVGCSMIKVRRHLLGQGYGSRMLDALCEMADRHQVALRFEVVPSGRLDQEQISQWYARRGFEVIEESVFDEGPAMGRSPKSVPAASPVEPPVETPEP